MGEQFKYDVFLSHSSKDKAAVCPLAERLRKDIHFIPLRLDDAPINGSLAQFLSINWKKRTCAITALAGAMNCLLISPRFI